MVTKRERKRRLQPVSRVAERHDEASGSNAFVERVRVLPLWAGEAECGHEVVMVIK